MQSYVINLDRRPDRLAEISAHLKELGLPFERIPALDGQLWDGNGWKKQGTAKEQVWRGAAGCYFSHLLALRTAIDRNIFPCIILEDDAVLSEKPEPEEGMVYLGGFENALGIYGLHAVMYSDKYTALSFLAYAKKYKNTIDSIANKFRKQNDSICKKYHKGFIATQRRSFSDITETTVRRSPAGTIPKSSRPA